MKFDNKLGRHLIVLFMLFPLFVLSQKEYFPTNSGVKVVNEPYKAFINATIIINSERTIENGTIIIFPSYLPHQVVEHKDSGVRKSLAVNFIPIGEIGTGNGSMSIT